MGFSIYYRSTAPVAPAKSKAIVKSAKKLCQGRTWLGCEPVKFYPVAEDGHLSGGSKPNFQPHPDDAASAEREGLPNGTVRDLLDVLCQLSQEHAVDWEIRHNYSEGVIGAIRGGLCDEELYALIKAFGDLGGILGDLAAGIEEPSGDKPSRSPRKNHRNQDDDDDEGPMILSFPQNKR